MPGGNGSGPLGMGPMTGRGAGRCAGYGVPGYTNNFPGQGWGRWGRGNRWSGRDRGFAWSFPRSYPYPNAADEDYQVGSLEQEARYLESSLEAVRKEIAAVKARKGVD